METEMQKTSIEWCDWSANPLKLELPDGTRINACVHKSRGCEACYAETITRRWWKKEWGKFPGYTPALLKLGTPVLVEEELKAVLCLSRRIAEGKADPKENKIFWNDMTDEYLEFWPDEFIDKLFAVRALTPNLIHQVLTKRAERMFEYLSYEYRWAQIEGACAELVGPNEAPGLACPEAKPLPNVWLGVSVEDQKTADERIPWLLKTPAAVRWVSFEPLLDCVKLPPFDGELHWAVIGGESGPKARECSIEFAMRPLLRQLREQRIPVFIKQLGAWPGISPAEAAGRWRKGSPSNWFLRLKDKKGGDINEWPTDIRVREFPKG